MIDASAHPFAENISITRQVVEYAHDHGVVVEAELGKLAGVEDDVKVDAKDASYTDPDSHKVVCLGYLGLGVGRPWK